MKVEELEKQGIPKEYIEKIKEEKIEELYPPQADVIKKGLFRDKSVILSIPTAGGKTLIATIAMLHKLLQKKTKVVYIVPLVALAYEKYEYFKNFFGKNFKVAISIGDYDSSDSWLAEYDVICVTTEKLDSLLRHNVKWVEDIGLVVVDEIHLLNDQSRGPTLEILLTKLRRIIPHTQIFGLSATINNAKELSEWLSSELVKSDFRPVKLYEGVSFDSKIHFQDKESYELDDSIEPENSIISDTMLMKKQILVFTSTRKNAESLAERLCKTVRPRLNQEDKTELVKISSEIENVLDNPTHQCKKIAECIKSGVAFHHAGLMGKQKSLIENYFKNGIIKTIVATPTLAMGVNLPAFRVLIRDFKRYYQGEGSSYIPVLEYKQFVGRAGRPKYDSYGESILLAKTEYDAKDLFNRYVLGEPEDITSKLSLESVLRMHILALIASNFCDSEQSIIEFFKKTFYAHQFGNIDELRNKINDATNQLIEWNFILNRKSNFSVTIIGKRISELYIDPFTANIFLQALQEHSKKDVDEFSFLQIVSNSSEIQPLLSVKASELEEIKQVILRRYRHILSEIPEEYDIEFDKFLKSIKTSLMFESWINESSEEELLSKYNVAPGELYGKLILLDWLLYTLHELSMLSKYKDLLTPIKKLRVRSKYGIRTELIPLVKLKSIGRVRARKLYRNGFTTIDTIRKSSVEKLTTVLGSKIAQEIKNQLGNERIIEDN